MRRSLSLKRETLSALTTEELVSVNGGQQELTHVSCNPTNACTHGPSFDQQCPTTPVNYCISPLIAHTIPCL